MKRWGAAISLLGILVLAGCGNDQYAIEKQYWQTQKQAEKIFKNPEASPAQELNRIVNLFNGFVTKYPQTRLAVDADFSIARLYLAKKEYPKARAHLKSAIERYKNSPVICSEAAFLVGNSYEMAEQWNNALGEYKNILQQYNTTPRGVNIPMYIAQYYKSKYQPDKMMEAYQEAALHYKNLAQRYPDTPLAYNADLLAAQCYIATKDWHSALQVLNSTVNKYQSKTNVDGVYLNIAMIYKNELKNKAKTKETLEKLIREYPKSRLIKIAKYLLKEIEK